LKQSVVVGILIAFQIVWMQTTCLCISDVVKASTIKAKPRAKATGQGLDLRGQGQGRKNWPRGASRPRPGLEDYITALYLDICSLFDTAVIAPLQIRKVW